MQSLVIMYIFTVGNV